ncbi:hypothetical protein DL93DRAFT_2155233, partial [Clavulina sp. PMI_390]
MPPYKTENVTAVLLSWKRVANVIRIVQTLAPSADVKQIRVWNNNPEIQLTPTDFGLATDLSEKLWIHNSPTNLFFQARFVACLDAPTDYCFLQDDDYLIEPHVLHTMARRAAELHDPLASIQLLAPDEYLKSILARLTSTTDTPLNTTFAWFGFGAIVPRVAIVEFLRLLDAPDWQTPFSEDEKRMADNYYSVLSNRIPDIWVDKGQPLGHEHAFTVGAEGDDRNWQYIQAALNRLQECLAAPAGEFQDSFVNQIPFIPRRESSITRAPCLQVPGVVETNIAIIPNNLDAFHTVDPQFIDIRRLGEERRALLAPEDISRFFDASLSNAVDGSMATTFRSAANARDGDYIVLDTLESTHIFTGVEITVAESCGRIVQNLEVRTSENGDTWRVVKCEILRTTGARESDNISLTTCNFVNKDRGVFSRYIGVFLSQNFTV